MGGSRASHYLFVSTVVPIRDEFRMWETRNGPRFIEDVWERMAMKKREMKGHGEPIIPHVVEFQENNGAGPDHPVLRLR